MAVPTVIGDLSTTALNNAPSGEDAPSTLDNIQRAHASFIAQLRDSGAVLNDGLTTQILVGGGAEVTPVWTAATGSGAPVRATSPTLVTPALGTPASGVVTNLTGTASININGTVGATTPSTGVFSAATALQTSAGAITYPQSLQNAESATDGTGVGQTFFAHVNAATGRMTNVRDGAGLYSLRFSTFINGAALTEILRLKGTGGVGVLSGGLTVDSAALLGYGTGAGGTVTQATSKSTAVTLNKPCGQITMNAAALAANTAASFNVACSVVGASDVVVVNVVAGVSSELSYTAIARASVAGTINIVLRNVSAGSLSEAVVLQFATIKGATS